MRAVKTILSISFLLLAAKVFAGEAEVSNELPDEIKNLDKKKILQPSSFLAPIYPEQASTKSTKTIVWVKFKLGRNGSADSAVVVYCEEPNNGFKESAVQFVLESTFRPKLRKRRVDNSWFYTEVKFYGIDVFIQLDTDNLRTSNCPDSLMQEPEIIRKWRSDYPRKALRYGKSARVILRVLIDEKGNAARAIIMADNETLDALELYGFKKAAISGARKCKFKPMLCDGQPMECWVSFPYEFILNSDVHFR